jgi:uncharacterized protein with HEPN domain
VTRTVDERMQDILAAIMRARVADKRLRLGESLGDDVGVQIAYQAILYNLSVIGETVKAIPVETLDRATDVPWADIAAMGDVLGRDYQLIVPADVRRMVDVDLGHLEAAVRRLKAAH